MRVGRVIGCNDIHGWFSCPGRVTTTATNPSKPGTSQARTDAPSSTRWLRWMGGRALDAVVVAACPSPALSPVEEAVGVSSSVHGPPSSRPGFPGASCPPLPSPPLVNLALAAFAPDLRRRWGRAVAVGAAGTSPQPWRGPPKAPPRPPPESGSAVSPSSRAPADRTRCAWRTAGCTCIRSARESPAAAGGRDMAKAHCRLQQHQTPTARFVWL